MTPSYDRGSHEIATCNPSGLAARVESIADDVQTGGQCCLVHESHQINGGTSQEDLSVAKPSA